MAQIQGRYALTYEGVNAPTPPNFIFETRAPTTSDYIGIDIGTIWLNQIKTAGNPPVYSTSLPYMLVAKAQSFGTWVPLGGGGGGATPVTNTVYFNTPGTFTYTPTIGISQVSVECLGGGGAGFNWGFGSGISLYYGGSAGGYCKKLYTAAQIGASQTVVVGAAGLSGIYYASTVNVPATIGGNTTFMGMTAFGAPFPTAALNLTAPTLGGAATGGDINIQGASVTGGNSSSAYVAGANSQYGAGGLAVGLNYVIATVADIPNATGWGSGGSSFVSNPAVVLPIEYVGSNGAPGICIITEYF